MEAAIQILGKAGFALLDTYTAWSDKRAVRGSEPVSVSIGLHFGEVIVGNVGTKDRREFTVIGDVVNVASRLERATRGLEGGSWSPMPAFKPLEARPKAVFFAFVDGGYHGTSWLYLCSSCVITSSRSS